MGKSKLNATPKVAIATTNVPVQQEKNIVDALVPQHQQISNYEEEDTSTAAYLWLLVFSVLMFTFPFMTFYAVRTWLEEAFEFNQFQTNCCSVLASVLVVNFIICLYVFKAFREGQKSGVAPTETPENKKLN